MEARAPLMMAASTVNAGEVRPMAVARAPRGMRYRAFLRAAAAVRLPSGSASDSILNLDHDHDGNQYTVTHTAAAAWTWTMTMVVIEKQ